MSTSILERLKTLAIKVEGDLPAGVQKLTVVLEQKAEAVEAAAKREAAALEASVPAEVEEYLAKIEASVESHTAALAHLFETHAVAPAAAPDASAAETPAPALSDAIPTTPVL